MPAKPSVNKCDDHNSMVNRHIGTAYDNVRIVAENIEAIIDVSEGVEVMNLYLGAFATPPTEGWNGAPLVSGNFYLNTTTNTVDYYDADDMVWIAVDSETVVQAAQTAVAARDAALLAQAAAELAETNAESSAAAALASENAAALSEANALASENAASQSESNAATSASNALASENASAASEAAAAQSESNASTSATNAANSASAASTSASNASASESAAANSAVVAAGYAADAEAAFDNFTDRYLGAYPVDPTTDNDGNPLMVGASYWNTTTNDLRFWNGATWDVPEQTASQAAQDALAYRDDAQISETNAANSAAAAALSETNALSSQNVASLAASSANASANNAATSESNAATSESNAATSASNAATSEANAAQSAADAQQSADDAANTLSELEWKQFVRNEAELNQMREQNKSVRAASGFDHYGKHVSGLDNVNEGLWVRDTLANDSNSLYMGRDSGSGSSKTDMPVSHIAGAIFNIVNLQRNDALYNTIKFPEAPNGTVIYDSTGNARGTGNATLNLLTDVDPKYGDVAGDVNEAVARAFEGELRNGDFRLGDNGDWSAGDGGTILRFVNNFLEIENGDNTPAYANGSVTIESGETYTVSFYVDTSNNGGNLARIICGGYDSNETFDTGFHEVTFTTTNTGALILSCSTSGNIGEYTRWSNVAIRKATEEVVIERHDMFGAEFFLEEVSQTNPYVYPKGMVQSQTASMNGITTTTSNRPVTYYAVYDGDTGSQGLGVDFWAATDEQKKAMVSDETNNIFMLDDGRLVQWRMRQRTIAGGGNGDWALINPSLSTNANYLYFSSVHRPVVQGFADSVPAYVGGQAELTFGNLTAGGLGANAYNDRSLYTARFASDRTINGECYFHVWGVVPRLNQGAYHPSLNPMGARRWRDARSGSSPGSTLSHSVFWYDFINTDCVPTTTAQAFNVQPTGVAAQPAASSTTGFIGAASGTGRHDDKLYDAIYASGQGGVIDYRLPSWDMSSKEEASKVFQKVVNGSYRGEERLTSIKTFLANATTSSPSGGRSIKIPYASYQGDTSWITSTAYNDTQECYGYVIVDGIVLTVIGIANDTAKGEYWLNCYSDGQTTPSGVTVNGCIGEYVDSSVSGEFTMVDVIGNPANILATPALANGWLGGWAGTPTSSGTPMPLSRKNVGETSLTCPFYANGTWGVTTRAVDSVKNELTTSASSTTVMLVPYNAFAKQTKEANNAKILNAEEGIGNVFQTEVFDPAFGCLFAESLLDKVPTDATSGTRKWSALGVKDVAIDTVAGEEWLHTTLLPVHEPVSLGAPTDPDSPAVKALWYQKANNQQVSMNFVWNELVYRETLAPVQLTSGVGTTLVRGQVYYYPDDNIPFGGKMFQARRETTHTPSTTGYKGYHENASGELVRYDGIVDTTFIVRKHGASSGWGDDSTIHITDGTATYTNLNGDTCLYGTAELSIPYGYTKNQARIGSQVSGVDL